VPKTKQLEEGKHKVADIARAEVITSQRDERLCEAMELLTAVRLTQSIGRSFSAQSFRALQRFAELKGFEVLGFTRFDDFLTNSPRSPMSRDQFYERKEAIDREGDEAFDTLNSLRIPLSARKLLSSGSVTIEGDKLYIGQNDDEQVIEIADRSRIVEAIRTLAQKQAEQSRTIERGKKDVEKLKRKLDEAQQNSVPKVLGDNPHDNALSLSLFQLGGLKAEVEKLSLPQAIASRDNAMRMLTAVLSDIRAAYRFDGDKDAPHFMRDQLSDDDLDEIFDDK
jgi:hypothetical protein